jgi:hypothetical protein
VDPDLCDAVLVGEGDLVGLRLVAVDQIRETGRGGGDRSGLSSDVRRPRHPYIS